MKRKQLRIIIIRSITHSYRSGHLPILDRPSKKSRSIAFKFITWLGDRLKARHRIMQCHMVFQQLKLGLACN